MTKNVKGVILSTLICFANFR